MTLTQRQTREQEDDMLWYNNPDAVKVIHENMIRESRRGAERRRLLRLISEANSNRH
jgi:hypothetical protein